MALAGRPAAASTPDLSGRTNTWYGPAAAAAVLVIAAATLTSFDATVARNTPVAEIAPEQPRARPLFGEEPSAVVAGFVDALNRADFETALDVLSPTIDGFGLPGVPHVAQFDRPSLRGALHHFHTRDTRLVLTGCDAAVPAPGATMVHCGFAVDNSYSRALDSGPMLIDMAFEVAEGTITNAYVVPIVGVAPEEAVAD